MKRRKSKHSRRRPTPRPSPKKRNRRSGGKSTARAAVLRTVLLGEPVELIYRHAHGGTYSHKFKRGTRVSYTHDGRALVIDGSSVKAFIEG